NSREKIPLDEDSPIFKFWKDVQNVEIGKKIISYKEKFMNEQLNEALKEFQNQIENGDYKILHFWADVTKPHA
ncbi:25908_t:CDS:2, partial [Gigaspora rosea]